MIAALLLTAGVTVTLPESAEVRGTELFIGAIATVTGEDPALVARIEAGSLGYAPAPGFSRLLDGRRVAADLQRMFPSIELHLDGAARCRVTPAVATVSAAALLEEAGGAMRAALAGADARVTSKGQLVDLVVPAANTKLELRARLDNRTPRAGTWSVPVEIVVDGAVYRTLWTRWNVELWERRYVLRHNIAAGAALTSADFELARVAVGSGPGQHALEPVAFRQATARRALLKGESVTDRDVERQIVIRRGDMISLEVKRGAVTVRAWAIAQRDARIGDRLPVRLEKTGKQLVAVVSGPETVQLRIK